MRGYSARRGGQGRAVAPVLAAALALAVTGAAAAAPATGPLVSIPSVPLAGCTADGAPSQVGTSYPGTQIEPWVAVNPASPSVLLAGWQQDRWSNGGARTLGVGRSVDGGASWTSQAVPGSSKCASGVYTRATDPWVSFGPTGIAYFFTLGFEPDPPEGGNGDNAMLVSRSTNGGRTWGPQIPLIVDTEPQFFNDKNALTADPTSARHAYAVWDRLEDLPARGNGSNGALELNGAPDGTHLARSRLRAAKQIWNRGSSPVNQPFLQFKGPALISRTTDSGRSWSPAAVLYDPGVGNQTIGNQVAVRSNGAVYAFFTEILNTAPGGVVNLGYKVSADRGASFGALQRVGVIDSDGALTPDRRIPVRDGSILFDVAAGPAGSPVAGNLYAVWQDRRFAGVEQVAFSMSTNGGASWSAPIRVSLTPAAQSKLQEQAFLPSVEVAANGTLVVTYYDFRNDTRDGELADYWAAFCTASCASAASWGSELRLTNGSFDYANAPFASGLFLGDYLGLTAAGTSVWAVFGVTSGPSTAQLNARRIEVGP